LGTLKGNGNLEEGNNMTSFFSFLSKRGGNVSIKEKRERKSRKKKKKNKKYQENLKRNGSIEGRSSSELESWVGFLGKVKNVVCCANVSEDREGLGMVSNKRGIGLSEERSENREAHWASCSKKLRTSGWVPPRDSIASGRNLVPGGWSWRRSLYLLILRLKALVAAWHHSELILLEIIRNLMAGIRQKL
jgi:hypothetical protein